MKRNKDRSKRDSALNIVVLVLTSAFLVILCVYLLFRENPPPLSSAERELSSSETSLSNSETNKTQSQTEKSDETATLTSQTLSPTSEPTTSAPETKDATETEDKATTEALVSTEPSGTTEPSETTEPPVTKAPEVVYMTVDDTYFSDALFIGDSMIETFARYADVKTTSYYFRGIMINNVLKKKFVVMDGVEMTISEALEKNSSFKKIYLMFGTNEQGWTYPALFKDFYEDLILKLKSLVPDAIIYVMGTFPVMEKAEHRTDSVYDNEFATLFASQEFELCEEYKGQNVYYLDTPSIVVGEDGYMKSGVSLDGIHPHVDYVKIWLQYLKTHAIDKEKSGY